jgi:hypothetical protein
METTVQATEEAVQRVVDPGALAAQAAKPDDQHLIVILTFASAEDADRVAREVGGPWMPENVVPLLARDTSAASQK